MFCGYYERTEISQDVRHKYRDISNVDLKVTFVNFAPNKGFVHSSMV